MRERARDEEKELVEVGRALQALPIQHTLTLQPAPRPACASGPRTEHLHPQHPGTPRSLSLALALCG
eukprot:2906536-Rhodomonas_salina.1